MGARWVGDVGSRVPLAPWPSGAANNPLCPHTFLFTFTVPNSTPPIAMTPWLCEFDLQQAHSLLRVARELTGIFYDSWTLKSILVLHASGPHHGDRRDVVTQRECRGD